MVLSATHPLVFVSKSEVADWPIVGAIASGAGTLFVRRQKRTDVARINAEIQRAFDAGLLVCVFPEGTSSDGSQVLPFQPSLLQPALSAKLPIYPAHIRYCDDDGERLDSVAYFGDRELTDCLRALLWRKQTDARVKYGPPPALEDDRKKMASLLHAAVSSLGSPCTAPSDLPEATDGI